WTSDVWYKLATRFLWVSSTLLGSPVVPLEVGSSARFDEQASLAGASAATRSDPKGVVPATPSPITNASSIAVPPTTALSFCPASPAVVTSHRAPVWRSWRE